MWLFLDCGWNDVLDVASGQAPEVSDASNARVEAPRELDETKSEQTSTTVQLMRAKTSQKRVKNAEIQNDGCMSNI